MSEDAIHAGVIQMSVIDHVVHQQVKELRQETETNIQELHTLLATKQDKGVYNSACGWLEFFVS